MISLWCISSSGSAVPYFFLTQGLHACSVLRSAHSSPFFIWLKYSSGIDSVRIDSVFLRDLPDPQPRPCHFVTCAPCMFYFYASGHIILLNTYLCTYLFAVWDPQLVVSLMKMEARSTLLTPHFPGSAMVPTTWQELSIWVKELLRFQFPTF